MKKLITSVAALSLATLLTGCKNFQVTPTSLSTNVKDIDVNKTYKQGRACSKMYFGLGPFGDMSVQSAARYAGITKNAMVDFDLKMYYVYGEFCAVVKGE